MPTETKIGPCAEKCAGSKRKTPPFVRVLDGRKQPIRNLWRRGGKFYAQLTIPLPSGAKTEKRIALSATSVSSAKDELAKLRQQRNSNTLQLVTQAPLFGEFVETYLSAHRNLKRQGTLKLERIHLTHCNKCFAGVRLNKITKAAILAFRAEKLAEAWAPPSANRNLSILRGFLRYAVDNGVLLQSPADGIRPVKWVPRKRGLVTQADIDRLCAAGLEHLKHGQQFADFVRLMCYCGSRRNETLRLKWADVNWERKQLTIGADGLTKNHQARTVDFNPSLETHLRAMQERKREDSDFLFPPMRGEADEPLRSKRTSLEIAREKAGLPGFGFHDCRHHFISYCVMSGIDYMTIAAWVGHQDGGVLIGRVYGHLADAHKQQQAQRVNFGPAVVETQAQVA